VLLPRIVLLCCVLLHAYNRSNHQKADAYRDDHLLQAAWSAFVGYVIARRTERFRWEHRHTALAVAHYRYGARAVVELGILCYSVDTETSFSYFSGESC
jgi:hypothetical protein